MLQNSTSTRFPFTHQLLDEADRRRFENSVEFHRQLCHAMLLPRMFEERMLILLRQGKLSKWFSGIGQEAISVGATAALKPDDFIMTMHRNLGVFTTRGVPLLKLFAQLTGKAEGFTEGRDRSFHFGTREYHIVGMISHLAAQLGVAAGIGLAEKLSSSGKVALAFTGEGGTSQGDFHEALNVAATWQLPVIFIVENNAYALSTPTVEQYRCAQLSDRGVGYGMAAQTIDGNDVEEVYETVSSWADKIRRNPQPVLIECTTFRMRGHEETSGTKYVPQELLDQWEVRDPVQCYLNELQARGGLTAPEIEAIKAEVLKSIEDMLEASDSLTEPVAMPDEPTRVFVPHAPPPGEPELGRREIRFVDSVQEALLQAMEHDDELLLMGQDIGPYGGVFKVTEGFVDKFGADRVRNTPLCESAILGAALGLSIAGRKSMVEMQFSDFVSCGFNQIVNNLAKAQYRWGQNANAVVRLPCGGGVGAGPYHSQTMEAWFLHVPGLKVFYPSTPYDAKGLLLEALVDPNPVLFFEHKKLYRSTTGAVPEEYYRIPSGKARIVASGEDVTIVTYGLGVHWALQLAEEFPEYSLEIVDLRTLNPLDEATVFASVAKTSKVLVLHEATLTMGFGAELAALIGERCFEYLDGPVMRCASLDTPVPFAGPLEEQFLASSRAKELLRVLLEY